MPETKRARRPDPLDTASDHMAELLRRADELLLEWSKFGVEVRAQVDREAQQIGGAVCDAVDLAVRRAAADGTARAISDQLGTQLAAVSAEIAKLESRARAASRAIAEQRRGDRTLLYGVIAAVLIANVLLVVLLLRRPEAAESTSTLAPVATPVVVPVATPPIVPAPVAEPGHEDRAAVDKADAGVLDPKPSSAKEPAPRPELKAVPPARPVRQGPPAGRS